MHTYVLHHRLYCARCVTSKPHELVDARYGKMRPRWNPRTERGEYLCLARDRGYEECGQGYVLSEFVNEPVLYHLSDLNIPDGYRQRVEDAVRNRVENAAALGRMQELQAIVERIDFSWETDS